MRRPVVEANEPATGNHLCLPNDQLLIQTNGTLSRHSSNKMREGWECVRLMAQSESAAGGESVKENESDCGSYRKRNMEAGAAFNFLRAICVDHICYNGSAWKCYCLLKRIYLHAMGLVLFSPRKKRRRMEKKMCFIKKKSELGLQFGEERTAAPLWQLVFCFAYIRSHRRNKGNLFIALSLSLLFA